MKDLTLQDIFPNIDLSHITEEQREVLKQKLIEVNILRKKIDDNLKLIGKTNDIIK